MPPPPSEPADPILEQLRALRQQVDALDTRLDRLTQDNRTLQERLTRSEEARRELSAQTERLVELLDQARKELREHGHGYD